MIAFAQRLFRRRPSPCGKGSALHSESGAPSHPGSRQASVAEMLRQTAVAPAYRGSLRPTRELPFGR